MSFHSLFQSKVKTLASTLEISTILVLRHKEQSSGGRSWVLYKKRAGITQATCTRTAQDAHKPHAWESHVMCISHVHEDCMGHTHVQQHKERLSSFSRHVLCPKELIRKHPDPSMSTFSLDLYSIMVFEAIIFHCVRYREPLRQMHAPYEIQGMGTE